MHPILRTGPPSRLSTSMKPLLNARPTAATAVYTSRQSKAYLSTWSEERPKSHGGYGDGSGDPKGDHPMEQGEVDPASERLEHPGTQKSHSHTQTQTQTHINNKPSGQQQQQPSQGQNQPSSKGHKPTMTDDRNDLSNEATNVPPERQSEDVRRHNEDVVHRHDMEYSRDKVDGREK